MLNIFLMIGGDLNARLHLRSWAHCQTNLFEIYRPECPIQPVY